jgi:NitT/TauT family transport system substrate-binding protein
MDTRVSRSIRAAAAAWLAALGIGTAAPGIAAEVKEINIASGFGVQYLPLYVMKQLTLLEKHAKQTGLGDIKVNYLQFSGGAALNDAILSGKVDLVEGGVGPFALLWDRTRGNLNVKALAAMGDVPMTLITNTPYIHTVQDITDRDKIAVPAVKASMQAILLQMAAAKLFGDKNYDRFDRFTVTMPHADAMVAMLSKSGAITLHFSAPPFADQALADPGVRKVTDSMEIMGGPGTLNLTYLRETFYSENPAICRAYLAALKQTMDTINRDKRLAAKIYIQEGKSKLSVEMVEKILNAPGMDFTIVPHGTLKFVQFMHQVGLIKTRPAVWQQMFLPDIHLLAGS